MDFNERNVVKVDFATMEKLTRDSERLETIRTIVKNEKYVTATMLEALLGLNREGETNGI